MKDTLVSPETMQLLLEAGFEPETINMRDPHASHELPCITQSLAQKWFREIHNIDIVPVRTSTTHTNRKIYLDGIEWYGHDGLYVVEAGYEECLEKGIAKLCRWLIMKADEYKAEKTEC